LAETQNFLKLAEIAGLNPLTNLAGGHFSGISFKDAKLSGADLSGADLSGADLRNANLNSVNLNDAIVKGAKFGWNPCLPQITRDDLIRRGAKWQQGIQEVLKRWEYLSENDREWMINQGSVYFLDAEEVLIEQGKPIDKLYIVLEGSLSVLVDTPKHETVARLVGGEIVGEMSFVRNKNNCLPSATVKAEKMSLLWSIPRNLLIEKINQDDAFGSHFNQVIAAVLADRLVCQTLKLQINDANFGFSPSSKPNLSNNTGIAAALVNGGVKVDENHQLVSAGNCIS
jgi:hypothetical protein